MSKLFVIFAEGAELDPIFQNQLTGVDRKILKTLKTPTEFDGFLTSAEKPGVGTDWTLLCVGESPEELICRVKRHPEHHLVPIFVLKNDVKSWENEAAQKKGIYAVIEKNDFTTFEKLLEKYNSQALPRDSLRELDRSFVEELRDQTHEMRSLIQSGLDVIKLNELFRIFHTVKGTAKSLQFPHLGNFMHQGEEVLSILKSEMIFRHVFVNEILNGIFNYLELQAEQLRLGRMLELPPVLLEKKIDTFIEMGKCGWISEVLKDSAHLPAITSENPSGDEIPLTEKGIVSRTASSTRVTNEKLDQLQENFKKIIQLRTRLSAFANNLKSEFSDESFPNDLIRIVDGMMTAGTSIMEFFISLRVVPPTRLKLFTTSLVFQCARELGKRVDFEFKAEGNLEVDSSVLDVLEGSLTHLIKNSIDHGLETAEVRLQKGKSEIGKVRLEISKTSHDFVRVHLSDDGIGINHERLKEVVVHKGLMTREAVNRLSVESLNDLIFLDGLTTKTEVSDLSGRGVGMSAVKEEIVKLGGSLRVESESGVGSQFIISLPRIFKL